jgi:hypothetical protein
MEPISKKTLEHKLHIQHKNDRYDVIDIISEYFREIYIENEQLKVRCTESIPNLAFGCTFNQQRYDSQKKIPNESELTRRIMNMKQRKPLKDE